MGTMAGTTVLCTQYPARVTTLDPTNSNKAHIDGPESFPNWGRIGNIYQSASATMIYFQPLPEKVGLVYFGTGIT
jgi:hypothetical protein